jgi:muramoyltetrapeptide carboxypeptidase LdcA involved in peptidoglycan recycling
MMAGRLPRPTGSPANDRFLVLATCLLFGRPGGAPNANSFAAFDDALLSVVRDEEGLTQLPIISRMDFGHTDPMCVLPIGGLARIDCIAQTLLIEEAVVAE